MEIGSGMEWYDCQFFGVSSSIQTDETARGHSVKVLSSRPERITKGIRGAGAASTSAYRRGQAHGPNARGQQAEQAATTS